MNARTTLGLAALTLAATAVTADGALLLDYNFNGTTTSSGTASAPLILEGGAVLGGPGVSGAAGDLALDFTVAPDMGSASGLSPGAGPKAESGGVSVLGDGDSFTVAGWYKTQDAEIGEDARIVSYGDGNPWQLLGNGGNLRFAAGGTNFTAGNDLTDNIDSWVFFAATFTEDTTTAVTGIGTVELFVGDLDNVVVSLGSSNNMFALNGPLSDTVDFVVGNREDTRRPLDGFLDNIQLYNEALDLSSLEVVRAAVIPEPASLSALGLFGLLGMRRRRDLTR
jgi:hypothetical protein